ncbi:ribokinase [Testudinibacter sp. TR-2022]|uniref:ribokinase n=1 Tax=Testudinibacter sp. TR-2022 TaxID=2585029 RepID=UPI0011197C1F|nr:ribokinase [Testudinibacter sp. TR-2022]TNH04910.1 ribokinase [Pasteurellaceae bacterium Phil31]TNH06334.1 ribokinase [Testudinibacter sp. TR-2022]TNH12395.1 ribokinase [Testudinibacter sp. TR-2022]TNH14034.1 ribokinase [Testudinibacter sp. TR-2022]TNH16915.1 ribokinase [Testudinibacter sp. TR-2022]
MTQAKKLVVLGSINADHVLAVPHFVKPGETLAGNSYHIAYGGKGANQAVAAARLGTQTDFIACIGDDTLGAAMKDAFAQDGINIDSIVTIPNEMSGIAMIQVAANGENSIVLAAGANAYLDRTLVDKFADNIAQADALLMQLETPLSGIIAAAKIAKANGTQVILNPAPAQVLPDELLSQLDMITPNETETEILTGIKVNDEASATQAANVFHQKGIATVLITLGAKGVFVSEKSGFRGIIAGFRVQAVDTTAAGDTFNGALLTALLEQKSLVQAIRFAHGAAAISVTRSGAQPSIPTRQQTDNFLLAQAET